MFGYGTYFANKAKKSLGYASIKGSCWANGSDNTGFLGIYKVATGKPYDVFNAQSDLTYDYYRKDVRERIRYGRTQENHC